jgi:hypothetical protein
MDSHGALVGWAHQDLGSKLLLRIETVSSRQAAEDHAPDTLRVLLTKQQAALLGSYLFDLSGETAPRAGERGMLKRLFG